MDNDTVMMNTASWNAAVFIDTHDMLCYISNLRAEQVRSLQAQTEIRSDRLLFLTCVHYELDVIRPNIQYLI